ncbi:MAG: glycosyltransferase [Succinivibrio sp.]|jgi:spore maturation protein CgeB|nr:glycosyltransferase [Succinivibrio sp.]
MKITVCLIKSHQRILKVEETLANLGHSVRILNTDDYRKNCSYIEKKLDKLGFRDKRKNYIQTMEHRLSDAIFLWRSDLVLFINLPLKIFSFDFLSQFKNKSKLVCWFVDTVKDVNKENLCYLNLFDKIFSFERNDVSYLDDLKINSFFLPIGYNQSYRKLSLKKKYDLVFVGVPSDNRLIILEKLATHCKKVGLNFLICGTFYNSKLFWKKFKYIFHYPNILHFLVNRGLTPDEVCQLYNETKICLNIHVKKHLGLNPRTFEISASGAFQLVDKRPDYYGIFVPGFNITDFDGFDDLVSKINFYLTSEETQLIADRAYDTVHENYSLERSFDKLIEISEK